MRQTFNVCDVGDDTHIPLPLEGRGQGWGVIVPNAKARELRKNMTEAEKRAKFPALMKKDLAVLKAAMAKNKVA